MFLNQQVITLNNSKFSVFFVKHPPPLRRKKGKKMAEKVCECIEEWKARRKQRNGKKRHYTIQDLNRISLYVNRDEKLKPLEIIAELAYFHGYGTLFCKSAREIEKLSKAVLVIREVLVAITTAKVYSLIKDWLLGLPLKIGIYKWLLGFILVFYAYVEKVLLLTEQLLGSDTLSTVVDTNKEMCAYIRYKYGDGDYKEDEEDFNFDGILKDIIANDVLDISISDLFPFTPSDILDLFPTGDMSKPQ